MDFYGILFDIKNGSKMPYSKNYFDTLFAAKLEELGVKTITGTLPLTFTAKAGAADTWTIYGNDENGTENLFDGNYQAAFINTSTNKYSALNEGRTAVIQCDQNTQYTISVWSGCNRLVVGEFETEPQINDTANILAAYTSTIPQYTTITTGTNVHYIACYVSNQDNTPTITIVKGSTAPDHYIPYQQGVGERTKNLLEITVETQTINGVTFTVDKTTGTITADGTENRNTTIGVNNYITVDTTGSYILSGCPAEGSSQTWEITVQAGNTVVGRARPNPATVTLTAGVLYTVRCVVRNNVRCDNLVFKPMVRPASTSDTFIPYGYEIPLSISQDGQTDKNYDIYIGDTPLTEGETVSKTSTGVDLELFEGENTVSTTLYNKPTMTITYK